MPTVLVVDESVSGRKALEVALSALHVDVVCAGSAGEAIERFEAHEPDLVICDVILPDRDGYHVCEHVRAHASLSRVPVLLTSGIVNSTVLERAAEVRSSDVMFRPFTVDDLVGKVDHLLALRTPTPSAPSAAVASSPPEPATVATIPDLLNAPALDLKGYLAQFVSAGGGRAVVLADHDGLLVEGAGDPELSTEATAALAGGLAESCDGLGRALGRGALTGMMLEYESGTLLVYGVGSSAMLAVVVDDTAVLGRVRYYAKKLLPELALALASDPLAYRS